MQVPEKIRPLFDDPHIHNILEGGRGGGKSMTFAGLIALVMDRTPLNVLCTREIQKSLRDSSYAELESAIHKYCKPGRFAFKPSQNEIVSSSGGRAVFTGLREHTIDSVKSLKGFHWAWIEEAQSVSARSLSVLIPTLRIDGWFGVDLGDGIDRKFPLRMFGYTLNPYTWDDPINHVLPDSRPDVQRIKVNYYDNPWFPDSLNEERLNDKGSMSPEEYSRVWEGVPFDDVERAIVLRPQIDGAMNRSASQDGGEVIGADIARFGEDRTVIYKRKGMQTIEKRVLSKKDTQYTARTIHDMAKGCKIVIDDTGVGGGVTDKLKDMGDNVIPINFGGKPKSRKKYPDIISEMWFEFASQIDEIGLLSDDMALKEELASRNFKYTNDERRKVESKEEYKKRTGRRSPDCADACILCYYNRGEPMSVSFY